MTKLNIGIIGGSIAGCSAAILLGREGVIKLTFSNVHTGTWVVEVEVWVHRKPVLEVLSEQDVVDANFPYLSGSDLVKEYISDYFKSFG